MYVSCVGVARIQHKETGEVFELFPDELEWDSVAADERQMGTEVCHRADVQHPELGALSWELWEYPIGMENDQESDVNGHTLLENFRIGISHLDEAWEDYDIPEDPYQIFESSLQQMQGLLATASNDGSHILNRMIFAQLISALEAYLCDTIINAAVKDDEVLDNLIENDKELQKAQLSLKDVRKDPNIVVTTVRAHLKEILYHNLARVNVLYKCGLGFGILSGKDSDLFKAIEYRHHCVHRNGFDNDGNKLTVFTRAYISRTAAGLKALVDAVERQLEIAESARRAGDFDW